MRIGLVYANSLGKPLKNSAAWSYLGKCVLLTIDINGQEKIASNFGNRCTPMFEAFYDGRKIGGINGANSASQGNLELLLGSVL